MNIFYVDTDANIAAQSMVDKHVVKMILESAQLLSTAHRILDGEVKVVANAKGRKTKRYVLADSREDVIYKSTHANHPSAVWARENSANYDWLYDHMMALGREYTHRYGRMHLSIQKLETILSVRPNKIPFSNVMTKMPSCMDDDYILASQDPVANYRNYYNKGKAALHRWTNRLPPSWIEGEVYVILPDEDDDEDYTGLVSRTIYTTIKKEINV